MSSDLVKGNRESSYENGDVFDIIDSFKMVQKCIIYNSISMKNSIFFKRTFFNFLHNKKIENIMKSFFKDFIYVKSEILFQLVHTYVYNIFIIFKYLFFVLCI